MNRSQSEGRVSLDVWAFGPQIKLALETDSWEVVNRRPTLEDDPAEWDLVVVGLSPMLSFAAPFQYAALRLLAMAIRRGNAATFVDDWQLRSIVSHFNTCLRHPEYLAGKMERGRANYQWAIENRDCLLKTVSWLTTHPWPNPIWPRFSPEFVPYRDSPHEILWGKSQNGEMLFRDATWVDPSATVENVVEHPVPAMEDRDPGWVKASLTNAGAGWWEKTKRVAEWPILEAGKKEWTLGKVPEPELVSRVYTKRVGVVSTPYSHVGSGWFRVRYRQAGDAGCVLLSDPREVPHAEFGLGVQVIERMTTSSLASLAQQQRERYRSCARDRANFDAVVQRWGSRAAR